MKKALSLLLAVVMIVLLLPITMLPALADETETETTAATIKYVKLFAKYGDEWDVHTQYGSVAAITDGDPNPGYVGSDKRSNYTYYQSDDLYDGITYYYLNGENKLELNSDDVDENKVYMGFAMFELNGVSAIDDVTIWLAGDTAAEWKNPATAWNMNDEYDILVSNDGETWTVLKEFTEMCGDGNEAGANFPAEGDAARAVGTDGKLGHKIDLDGAEAKYFAIGVKHGMMATDADGERNAIVIGEVTVNGTVVTPDPVKKTPAEIYAEAQDGDLLQTVNFNDISYTYDYMNSDNWNTYTKVSEDGRTVRHLIHSKKSFDANNKRAMWGGIAEDERLPLDGDNKYTIYFDTDFGKAGAKQVILGIQVFDDQSLTVDGYGYSIWYDWNDAVVPESSGNDGYDKWNYNTDIPEKSDVHSFAIEVNAEAEEMTLYVASVDGSYNKVRTLTYQGANITESLKCAIYARSASGTVDGNFWAEISNIEIYKGLVAERKVDRAAEYDNAKDGDLLHTVDFGSYVWNNDFANSDNCGANVIVSKDGSSATLKVLDTSSKRAMWGGLKGAYAYPMTQDENGNYRKYTVTFNVDFGSQTGGKTLVGIQVDGDKTITLDGNGNCKLWAWNSELSASDAEKYPTEQWDFDGLWRSKGATHTFALEIDPENGAMTLYIMDLDGVFYEVLKYEDVDLGSVLSCRVYTRSYTTGSDVWTRVSNIQVYKGFPISTEEDRAAEYENAKEGDLLTTLNFADRFNWHQGFYSSSNYGADAVISEDGSSARLTLLEGVSYNRAIWGGLDTGYPIREVLNPEEVEAGADPIYKNNNYTVVFDLEFGSTEYYNYGLGIQVDGNNTILIDGFGCNYWYTWNDERVSKSDAGDDKWNYKTDVDKAEKHTFAVEVDPAANTLTLYVANADGSFSKVRSMTYEAGTDSKGDYGPAFVDETLTCRIYTRKVNSKKTSDENSWTEVSDVKIYKGLVAGWTQSVAGASVRISEPSGIRFSSEFRKTYIDSLRATYGEENVKLGMIITPTDYITNNGVEFEMAALDACATSPDEVMYVKVDATTIHEEDGFYTINCALAPVQEGNYNRKFSARAYIEVNGEIYQYAAFDLDYNSRSIAEVAKAAYGDLKDEADEEEYIYPVLVGSVTKYSPYTADERKSLEGFFTVANGADSASISVMTYNIEMYKEDGWGGRNISSTIKTITDSDPDVVGLQEDDSEWRSSGEYSALTADGYKQVRFAGNGSENLDIFYKSGKFNFVESGQMFYKKLADGDYADVDPKGADLSIDEAGDKEQIGGSWWNPIKRDKGRMFSYVVLQDKASGVVFLIVNTHLHYGEGTGSAAKFDDDDLVRDYQARLLRAWLDDMAEEYPNQIAMGDMNATPDTTTIAEFSMNDGLSFARNDALVKGDTAGTLASTSSYTVRQQYVFDHIIYRNMDADEYTVVDNMVDEVNGEMRYASDHLPVYAKFTCTVQ